MTIKERAAPIAPAIKREIQAAMWSVYCHAFFLPTLRRTVFDLVDRGLGPIPLHQALEIIMNADDPQRLPRRLRVLEILGRAGLVNSERLDQLRAAAEAAHNQEWGARIDEHRARVEQLCVSSQVGWQDARVIPSREFPSFLWRLLASLVPTCQVIDSTCETCYDPVDPATGRPITTVTVRAKMSRSPREIARVFDPRSWGTCFDSFETYRALERNPAGDYPPYTPDTDPIGSPWPPGSPQLFFERVTLATTSANIFENILRVTSFTVTGAKARLDFDLRESRKLVMPGLGINMTECVTIDEGHMEANSIASPAGGSGAWSQVELVKRVQYVDLTLGGSNDPLGLEPGELLNYYAPAILCLWLEDATKGSVCCQV